MEQQLRSNKLGYGKLKYLLTCRPYNQIVSGFHGLAKTFLNILILGEQESETISQEVNSVITQWLNQLLETKGLSTKIKSHLEGRLLEAAHRTYLWVYIVFNHLEKEYFKKTWRGVKATIVTLLKGVNKAYE